MKRRNHFSLYVVSAILCLCLTLLFSACNRSQPDETDTPAAGSDAVTVPATEAGSDAVTVPATEAGSDETTEPVTEAGSDETTEPATEAGSDETTEPVTEAGSDAVPPKDYEVSEKDGTAEVFAPSGLKYTVTGYTSHEGEKFTFQKALTFRFREKNPEESFNRFSLTYTSTEPAKIRVSYTQDGKELEDGFFLEAGDHVFSALVFGYADKKSGANITSMTVESCTGKPAVFSVSALTHETIEYYNGTYFLQNDRFKVGIDIQWGGTINYIGDKQAHVKGMDNLINRHDAGRLVQQSYYGTDGVPGEYEPGEFNHNKWCYNPVQGGDKHRNCGRLIDIQVRETSVYIKAQPMDWGLNHFATPSYAENIYSVDQDTIRVDNRFVDFSGWKHPFKHQELPAFYTVSYLNTFFWYNGCESWTDGEVSFRDDLNFWGDPKYNADCTIPLKKSNDETWCAWVNQATDYGIGLYVPNVDVFLAGRAGFNNSPDSKNGACNYVAPLNLMKIVAFQPLEYSYLITTGSVASIRNTFKENRDFAANDSFHKQSMRVPDRTVRMDTLDFTDPALVDVLTSPSCTDIAYDQKEKAVRLNVTGNDPFVVLDFKSGGIRYAASDYTTMQVEYRIPESVPAGKYSMDVFMRVGDAVDARTRYPTIADGQYHVLNIDLTKIPYWKGDITSIRLDYYADYIENASMYIKSFRLTR